MPDLSAATINEIAAELHSRDEFLGVLCIATARPGSTDIIKTIPGPGMAQRRVVGILQAAREKIENSPGKYLADSVASISDD